MKQQTFSDVEYSGRKRKSKREEFLDIKQRPVPLSVLPIGRFKNRLRYMENGSIDWDNNMVLDAYTMQLALWPRNPADKSRLR